MAEDHEVTTPLEERPLVTFALFSYNQEKYIREAIQGAFAQTYEPLEIILSDDCSTDRTFEIIEEMAANYRGKHHVTVIRNAENMGVTPHVLARGKDSNGTFVVVAAGDDVSKPNRVNNLVLTFLGDDSILGVTSAYDLIDDNGALISTNCSVPIGVLNEKQVSSYIEVEPNEYVVIQGSTAAYRRSVFDLEFPKFPLLLSEDNLLNFAIYSNGGRVAFRSDSLIQYRSHANALSNMPRREISLSDQELQSVVSAIKNINKMLVFQWISSRCKCPSLINRGEIAESLRKSLVVASWPEMTLCKRVLMLAAEMAMHRARFAKWQIARLLGTPSNYQPKTFLHKLQKRFIS